MSKKKKVALGVIFSILFIIVIAIIANFDFILMLKDGLFETQDNISIKKEEVKNKQQEALEDAGVSNVRPLTEEETKALTEGSLTEEEAVKIITGQATMENIKGEQKQEENSSVPKNPPKDTNPSDKNPLPDNKSAEEVNNKIAELVGKIYIIEARFTSELNALEEWARKEYGSLPRDKRPAKKKELAAYGIPKLTALEKSCDAEVDAVLEELSEVLKNAGQSTELVSQIKSAYTNKKKLTKSYYISEYM